MTSPDFSVLLLAWDDADPGVAVLGGTALPPTLPLVYELAAHHPVVALYPHLPPATPDSGVTTAAPGAADGLAPSARRAPTATTAGAADSDSAAPTWPEPGVLPDPLEVAADGPGVRLLRPAHPATPARPQASAATEPAVSSRLVGLDELLPPTQAAVASAHRLAPAPGAALLPTRGTPAALVSPARSQWPTPPGPPLDWQAPAAPYAGAGAAGGGAAVALPPLRTQPESPAIPSRPSGTPPVPQGPRHPDSPPPRPSATTTSLTAAFEETVEEMGASEASDLDAPEDDLLPDAASPTASAAPAAATAVSPALVLARQATAATTSVAPAPVLMPRQPRLEGLNFRMIQYARRAMQLVAGHGNFGVIYAPGWPAWLAALEIRNRTGRPLVLYAAALASDTAAPAERGWLLSIERMALRRARLVLVPDALMQQQLRARHGADLGEVRVVPAADDMALQLVLAEVALG